MAKDNYENCLKGTLQSEGGYSNDAHDPGGATYRGVIQVEYDRYRRSKGLSEQGVHNMTEDEMRAIYKANYWDRVHGDDLPAGLDYTVFDAAVNSGVSRAARWLAACDHGDDVEKEIETFNDLRLQFLKGLGIWRYFGKGWNDRVSRVRKASLQMHAGIYLYVDEHDWQWLQSSLNKVQNAGLTVDGVYGPRTREAVKIFQKEHDLLVDGICGVDTMTAVMRALGVLK
jgi:lysozyme family protein